MHLDCNFKVPKWIFQKWCRKVLIKLHFPRPYKKFLFYAITRSKLSYQKGFSKLCWEFYKIQLTFMICYMVKRGSRKWHEEGEDDDRHRNLQSLGGLLNFHFLSSLACLLLAWFQKWWYVLGGLRKLLMLDLHASEVVVVQLRSNLNKNYL